LFSYNKIESPAQQFGQILTIGKIKRGSGRDRTYKKLCGELGDSITLKKVLGGFGDGEDENQLQLKQWQQKWHSPRTNVAP
jgi:hypothetical protein